MKQVFISYPQDNAEGQNAARTLYSALQKEQISAFLDEVSIEPGDRWLNSLKQGIAECKVMLSIISAASHNRKWFEKEYYEAQKYDILVIPVMVDTVEIPMQFNDIQVIKLFGQQRSAQKEKLLQKIRQYLGVDRINPLIKKAIQAKRTEAYGKSMEIWQEVIAISPKNTRANSEIEKLQLLQETKTRGDKLLQQLVPRIPDIQPVFAQVAGVLNQAAKRHEASSALDLTEQFLDGTLATEDYIRACQSLFKLQGQAASGAHSVDYMALAERITRGEIALFLGSEVPQSYGKDALTENQLANRLAEKTNYEGFDNGLSSIAEYLRLKPEYGQSGLWNKLQTAIHGEDTDITLYKLLARTEAPLILISSAYDDTLELCFKAADKPFVEVSSIMNRGEHYDIGHFIVSYSDCHSVDNVYTGEELSSLKLYEAGYTIIYKIRGSCCLSSDNELKRDALTVSESDYFTFARYAEKIIPNYLTKQFRGRGFLFLGFNPTSWEQRLMVNSLLAKRKNTNEGCFTVGVSNNPLESAYWQNLKVQHYDVDLSQLDDHIEEVL